MLVRFDIETDSREEVLKSKLSELRGIEAVIESRLSAARMGRELDMHRQDSNF